MLALESNMLTNFVDFFASHAVSSLFTFWPSIASREATNCTVLNIIKNFALSFLAYSSFSSLSHCLIGSGSIPWILFKISPN
jgi:hypothetical protein